MNIPSVSGNCRVSVVIPTIGEPTLIKVIEALNKGTCAPEEIIIAIPKDKAALTTGLATGNVRILGTEVKGQVQQRIEGFKIAQHSYVMQVDSDIVIAPTGLEEMLKALAVLGPAAAVCPVYDNGGSRAETAQPGGIKNILKKILNLIMDGRTSIPPGTVTRAGIETWPPFSSGDQPYVESQWLPGGCVLHYKENLLLEDFYPFKGKAYGEDVLQSIMLRKKGIKLFICKRAFIFNEGAFEEKYPSLKSLMSFLRKTSKYRLRIVSIMDGSRLRLGLWLLYFSIANILRFYRSKYD